jgi:D-psicose/D-tagatose/L-ribulose 3-epimerase
MKIGMNFLLWTGYVTEEHSVTFRKLKAVGFDGVEIPVFDASSPAHYRRLGQILDDVGLERTAITILPDEQHNAISPVAAHREGAVSHLERVVECAHELGSSMLAGPWFQVLGHFTGERPSETELAHAADVHRVIAPIAKSAGLVCALEPLNRFEAHLLNTVAQSVHYARRVGDPDFGILYDTFHANIEEKDPIAALKQLHAAGCLRHIHISENDRGTPGRGHAKIRETIRTLKDLHYDGWLTIEAFGRAVPELAAATRVWRDFFPDPEQVYTEGYRLIHETWNAA